MWKERAARWRQPDFSPASDQQLVPQRSLQRIEATGEPWLRDEQQWGGTSEAAFRRDKHEGLDQLEPQLWNSPIARCEGFLSSCHRSSGLGHDIDDCLAQRPHAVAPIGFV
jgi:hypothetical protein